MWFFVVVSSKHNRSPPEFVGATQESLVLWCDDLAAPSRCILPPPLIRDLDPGTA